MIEKGLPKTVNLGNHTYTVSQEYDGYMRGAAILGEVTYATLEIRVRSDMPDTRKQESFCHEIYHGMRYEAGFAPKRVSDEPEVEAMGAVLFRMLCENDFSFMYRGTTQLQQEARDALAAIDKGDARAAITLLERLVGR